jgi:hypothetical protein
MRNTLALARFLLFAPSMGRRQNNGRQKIGNPARGSAREGN